MPHKELRTSNTYYSMLRRVKKHNRFLDPKWRTFKGFLHDMGIRPEGTVLDRIDNDRGYEPSNCRWATYWQSTENRTNTVWIMHKGKRMRVNEVAKLAGITPGIIYQRLAKGVSGQMLLSPVNSLRAPHNKKMVNLDLVRKVLSECNWNITEGSRRLGITAIVLRRVRRENGWPSTTLGRGPDGRLESRIQLPCQPAENPQICPK